MAEFTTIEDYEKNLYEKMEEYRIPDYMQNGVANYIMYGRPVGHFLTHLFENRLREAVNAADNINQERLHLYVKFLYNHAPSGCWGRDNVIKYWRERGGMRAVILAMK